MLKETAHFERKKEKKKFFTTGDVAELCGVHFRTVIRWIDKGYLKAHQLPGRGDRRIRPHDLVQFLEEHNISIPEDLKHYTPSILIVDNEIEVVHSIERILRKTPFNLLSALSGFEAGILLEAYRPLLMTLDLNMPGVSGIEVLNILKKNPEMKWIKVLIISGGSDLEIQNALNEGADDYLKKPFSNDDLIMKIKSLIPEESNLRDF
ncbi:MAG: response regulator [Bdellovibrionaceae bacterium]|nr:response regulator [Pseudobdellovibrionaceae bacterium]|tara:strand:+ start:6082 stop:6702 length:621 start_codon:yes stop_codon:yes gene_type:complete